MAKMNANLNVLISFMVAYASVRLIKLEMCTTLANGYVPCHVQAPLCP